MSVFSILFRISITALPWRWRRLALCKVFSYEIAHSAYISRLAWVSPDKLVMGEGSRIGPFSVAIHLDLMCMGKFSSVGRGNWISGYRKAFGKHFEHVIGRRSNFELGDHAAVTKNHIFDCTHTISIGEFTTVAGYYSQFITHGIDWKLNRQDCHPITIGRYCLIGTRVIAVAGASLADRCVVGAGAVIVGSNSKDGCLYVGVPAKPIRDLDGESEYFLRTEGYVW